MDPATIAATVIGILTPYAKDVGKKAVEAAAEVGVKKAEQLLGWLKKRFAGDAVAEKDLARFETDPEKHQAGLQATIEEKAQADPTFGADLQAEVKKLGLEVVVVQKVVGGKNAVAADIERLKSGKLKVEQIAENTENPTALRAGDLGA